MLVGFTIETYQDGGLSVVVIHEIHLGYRKLMDEIDEISGCSVAK